MVPAVPEGHTIHRLAARHRELFASHRVRVSSPQGRFTAEEAKDYGIIDHVIRKATDVGAESSLV